VTVHVGLGGRGLRASRGIAAGETILRAWGPQVPARGPDTIQVDVGTHVRPEGPLVLCNHSCEPNCGLLIRTGFREIEMRALRAIAAGEELSIDYETFEYVIEHQGATCRCGAPACRGRLPGYKLLPAEVRARYGEFIAEYLRVLEPDVSAPVVK
jgi:hypothetical protein